MDVVELDAATHRGIDDARDLREKAVYAPAASRFKVYIIDEAHQLTNEAANALLKLVEEPPPHLRFIFATTEPDKIIPTIRSRTFHYGFRLVPARALADHLSRVCESEGAVAEPAALALVARAGAGSVRDSLSVLGQLLAGAGPQGLTYAESMAALGLTDVTLIDRFVTAVAGGSAADMFAVVDSVIAAGHDPRRFVTDVLDRLRDLIVLRVDPQARESGLIDVPDEVGQRLADQAQVLSLAELSRAADMVSAGLSEIKGATAPRLQLELLCARVVLPDSALDSAAVLARLERLERAAHGGGLPERSPAREPGGGRAEAGPAANVTEGQQPPSAGSSEPSATAGRARDLDRSRPPQRPELRRRAEGDHADQGTASPPAHPRAAQSVSAHPAAAAPGAAADSEGRSVGSGAASAAGPGDLERVREAWPTILDRLAASSRVAWTAFHAATPVSCSAGALAVAVAESGYARAIAQRGHDERLRQAVLDVLSLDVTVDVLHDPDASASGATAGAAATGGGRADEVARTRRRGDPRGGLTSGPAPSEQGQPDAPRPGDVVRAAEASDPQHDLGDEPSPDDPDVEAGASGVELIARELGAQPIGEIDHS